MWSLIVDIVVIWTVASVLTAGVWALLTGTPGSRWYIPRSGTRSW